MKNNSEKQDDWTKETEQLKVGEKEEPPFKMNRLVNLIPENWGQNLSDPHEINLIYNYLTK